MEDIEEIYYGSRGDDFKALINKLLIKGKLKKKYIDLLTNEKNIQIYDDLFTSDKVRKGIHNYQFYETIGDAVAGNFLVDYSFDRFPFLQNEEGVQVVARIVIAYGAKKTFAPIAEKLGFWPFISSSQEDRNRNKVDLLEDVFEAFIGGTSFILNEQFRRGVGFGICYDILESIFNELPMSLRYEDLFDPKTRLKEIFDANKELGQLTYKEKVENNDKGYRITTSTAYQIPPKSNQLVAIGTGTAATKDNAQPRAAEQGIKYLNSRGFVKPLSPLFVEISTMDKYKSNQNSYKLLNPDFRDFDL